MPTPLGHTRIPYAVKDGRRGYLWSVATGCAHGTDVCPTSPTCWARTGAHRKLPGWKAHYNEDFSPKVNWDIGDAPRSLRKPALILVAFTGELFGAWVSSVVHKSVQAVVRDLPRHTFVFLTKAPHRMVRLNPWPDNAWLGASITGAEPPEVQAARYRSLLAVQGGHRWLSYEPALGPLALGMFPGLSWLVIGKQSGKGAVKPNWTWIADAEATAIEAGIPEPGARLGAESGVAVVTANGQPPVPDPLRDSLAQHLAQAQWIVWREMPLGPANSPQADVVAMKKSYSVRVVIYEVKQTRGDFLRDVREGKYERYLPYCHQLYFAAPAGVLGVKDVPEGTGLITRTETGWHVAIAPRVRQMTPTIPFLLALMFRGYEDFRETRRLQERVDLAENVALDRRVKKLGWQIGRRLADGSSGDLERAQEAKGVIEEFLGRPVPDISAGLYELRRVLEIQVPGWRSMGMAAELVRVAHDLVTVRDGERHWVLERLKKLAQQEITAGS